MAAELPIAKIPGRNLHAGMLLPHSSYRCIHVAPSNFGQARKLEFRSLAEHDATAGRAGTGADARGRPESCSAGEAEGRAHAYGEVLTGDPPPLAYQEDA